MSKEIIDYCTIIGAIAGLFAIVVVLRSEKTAKTLRVIVDIFRKPRNSNREILVWGQNNLGSEEVIADIEEFNCQIGLFTQKYQSEKYDFDLYLYNKLDEYKRGKIKICHLYDSILSIQKKIQSTKYWPILEQIFNNLIKKLNILKISTMNVKNIYVDFNDKKLRKDITTYEPYPDYWDMSDEWINEKIKKFVKKLRERNKNLSILDIGTGEGRIIEFLGKSGDTILLVEPDNERLIEAKSKLERKGICADSINEPFEDLFEYKRDITTSGLVIKEIHKTKIKNHFDVIICSHVIQHNSTTLFPKFYELIHSLLNQNGLLFLMFPISKSSKEEYVVHGLEFDVLKINKKDFSISKKNKSLSNLSNTFKNIGFDSLNIDLSENKDDSGTWEIKTNDESKTLLYEISERENIDLVYKRVFNKGLICSLNSDYANEFFSGKLSLKLCNEINVNSSVIQISTESKVYNCISSRHWLISDINTNISLMIFVENQNVLAKYVHRVIAKHKTYENLLSSNNIPNEFLEVINDPTSNFELSKINNSTWEILNDSKSIIAWIIKTESRYSLILNHAIQTILNLDKNILFQKQIPLEIKELFNIDNQTPNHHEFIIESETSDGWLIVANDDIQFYARNDSDWIRIFKTENVFNNINEVALHTLNYCFYPFEQNNKEIKVTPLIEDMLWEVEINKKNIVSPDFKILKVSFDNKVGYLIYRDKKYNRLSRKTFDQLCEHEIGNYKILPTHRFVRSTFEKNIKDSKLKIISFFVYHSFSPSQSFIDKFVFRDTFLNTWGIKHLKWIYKKFDIQDVFYVIKKK